MSVKLLISTVEKASSQSTYFIFGCLACGLHRLTEMSSGEPISFSTYSKIPSALLTDLFLLFFNLFFFHQGESCSPLLPFLDAWQSLFCHAENKHLVIEVGGYWTLWKDDNSAAAVITKTVHPSFIPLFTIF